MKTAVSLPDALFEDADRAAKRLGISRSELYARAIEEFLAKQRGREITEALDRVYPERDGKVDPVLAQLQYMAIAEDKEDW